MIGSISIAVNSLTGPAMLNLPSVFQTSGLIPTIFTIAFLCVLSTLCSLHMADTISKIPRNAHFHQEVRAALSWVSHYNFLLMVLYSTRSTSLT